MKLKIISCTLYAQPETDGDLQSLLKMTDKKEKKIEKTRQYTIHKKPKELCTICGKKVKILKMHFKFAHDPEFKTRLLKSNAEKRAKRVTRDTAKFVEEPIQ